jgi:pimeloyl-ACP methyl ester carboxylesterase
VGFVYTERGDGPLVVLFHGFPDTPHGWDTIATAVADAGHRVVTPWLRGYHPDTLVEDRGYGLQEISEDALALLDHLGADSAVLVGHDWGASMVYGAASLAPERVTSFCAVGIPHPSLIKPSPSSAWAVRHFLALRMPWAERSVARNDFGYLDELYQRWSPNWSGPERDACLLHAKTAFADRRCLTGALAYYRALSPRTSGQVTRMPDVPGLVVGGEHDVVAGDLFDRTAERLPDGSRALVVAGAGHWPHREDEPAFIRALLEFLSD